MKENEDVTYPKDRANFVSCVTLWWIFDLLWKGNSSPLEHEDLYSVRNEERAVYLTKRLREKWENEKTRALETKRKPRFWKALLRFFTWKDYQLIVFFGLLRIIGINVAWFSTIKLIGSVDKDIHNGELQYRCFIYAYGMAMGHLVQTISVNHFHLRGAIAGIQARAATVGILYKKVLRLSKISLSAGHVMELICDDSQRLATSGEWFIQYGILVLAQCTCAVGWLYFFVGWQVFPASFVLICLFVYRLLISKVDYKLRKTSSQLADKRLGYLREILTSIRSIKTNCMEEILNEQVRKIRRQEMKIKAKRLMIMSICYAFMSSGQQLGIFFTILLLVFSSSTALSYQTVFATMILFTHLTEKFCFNIPMVFRLATDVYTSLQRIQEFLEIDECLSSHHENRYLTRDFIRDQPQTTNLSGSTPQVQARSLRIDSNDVKPCRMGPYLNLCDVTCKLPSSFVSDPHPQTMDAPLLNYITLNILARGLVIITGPVGSGKSSLLACILGGELMVTNGTVGHLGSLAYVSETPWVFPGTIRENILFGLPYNEDWYQKTVKACLLEKDLKFFPQGDMSFIGEHGTTISGGQRTRVALARAVYSNADIYLLDDPLSSLDATVAENVFKNCLRGLLADRIVLLTTYTTRFLKEADYVVKLKTGVIVSQGTFESTKDELVGTESGENQSSLMFTEGNLMMNESQRRSEMKENKPAGELLRQAKEDRETGSVKFKVYREYFKYGASVIVLLFVALTLWSGQVLIVVVDYQVSRLGSLTKGEQRSHRVLLRYSALMVVAVFLVILAMPCIVLVLMNATYVLHNKMVYCLVRAPLPFHATNPVGRIINRFSQDINNLDEILPLNFIILCMYIPPIIATFVLASITSVILIPLGLVTLLALFFMLRVFLHPAMDIKRLMSVAGGPLYSHFSKTMEGIRTIRAHKQQRNFTTEVYSHIDSHHRALFTYYTAGRWFSIVVDILCVLFATIVSVVVLFSVTDTSNTAIAAVTILYATGLIQLIQFVIRLFVETHSQMTSAERTIAYTRVKPEKGSDVNTKPPENWPLIGRIQFKNVSLRHYEDGPKVLRNLTFDIKPSEKVGIAGRTGAGKSSLVAALMRMADIEGEIIVADVNVMELNVQSTRRNISVISQCPNLFSSSIRVNIDPSAKFTDSEIWDALDLMQMKSVISNLPDQLDTAITGIGSNFSVGERQLLHLARVSLKKSKIVVFDEATGKVDSDTDKIIQQIIRGVFKDCTVITIAHRLSTIMDCDRIMLLDCGEIVEFDKPEVLLAKKNSLLSHLYRISEGN